MELRHLRYFLAVAEELSFRKAAQRLYIAQPALSVQIRHLEEEIGADLFTREEGRGVKLTDAGVIFVEHARETLAQASQGVTRARQASRGELAHLSVGFVPAAEYLVFPRIVPALRERWPGVHLSFRDLKTAEQVEHLRRSEVDIGFLWLPVPTEGLEVQKLLDDTFVVVLPARHRLASRQAISIRDLSNEPLIFFPSHLYPQTYRAVEHLFLSAGAVMNVVYELENSFSMINFVALGGACSLLLGYTRQIRHDGVVIRPLKPPNVAVSLAIAKKKGRGGIVDAICRFTCESLA
jgi:DNA-binding transcriptional LysR family regulator